MTSMMKTGYKVGDVMTPTPVFVKPDTNLQECANLMKEKRIGSLLVQEENKLVGIFTEQDMVRKAMGEDKKPSEVTAKEIMNTNLVLTKPEEDLMYAMNVMRDNNVRHLPVVNEGQLVGLITLKDIMKIEPELFEIIREKYVLGRNRTY